MTIPIRPGPWSFLQTLGQGIGDTARADAEFDRRDREEATKQLEFLFRAASGPDKTIKAEALVGPTAQALMKRAGIGELFASNLMAQPQEQIAEGQSAALSQILPQVLQGGDQYKKEELAAGRIPTTVGAGKARVETATSKIQGDVLEGGGPAARRAAGVQSQEVATAAEQAATDPVYTNIGERSVDASMTGLKIGRIDTTNMAGISNQAWQIARNDAKSRGFTLNEELTRPYIDAAVQARLRQQEERDVKALRAGSDRDQKLLDLYQRQQQRVQAAIDGLPKPTTQQEALANVILQEAQNSKRTVQQVLDDPNTNAFSKEAYTTVQQYKNRLAALQAERQALGDNITQALAGQAPGIPDKSAVPAPSERRPGTGPAFNSPPPPDARGTQQKIAKLARYRELVAIEQAKKDPKTRRTQEELVAQVDKEFAAPAINLQTYGREKPAPKKPAAIARPQMERSDTPTRGSR